MGFKIASSGDCQNSQFWCTINFGTRLGGFLAPKSVSKPMVCKMASSGDLAKSGLKKTRPFKFLLLKWTGSWSVLVFFGGHSPANLGSQCGEPCENYKIQKWRFTNGGHLNARKKLGNGPNTVSGSTVSNTELSEFFWAH